MDHTQIEVREEGPCTVVTLRGQFIGGEETDAVRDLFVDLAKEQGRKVIVDFTDVQFANSALLGVLLSAHAMFARTQGSMVLAGMSDVLSDVFNLTKMHLIFSLYESIEVALSEINVSNI